MTIRCSVECDHAEGRYGGTDENLRLIVLTLLRDNALSSWMLGSGFRRSAAI